ncbi:MAG TPA: TIGR04283 family arsenosugar biosynthesis glycosyltransferase [Thermoanaerobaculia bacterium]|jgi:rSAM/selenodomain-associated transferase 2|nr:TIGR04283 family arsenosugar biosynthesis glycosyltransferase [Thermoanaerobaculia bacterium]
MRLAIVVPTLNEEDTLRRNLPAALAVADEVVVSDGGSADATVEVARSLGARVVTGPPGRGVQLNRGAAAAIASNTAKADILLFLHADTTLPPGGAEAVRAAVDRGAPGGAFFLRFDADRPMQRLGSWLVNRRTRWLRVPLGDQAQWATRETFETLGGFPDWPLLEDVDFMGRLRQLPGFTIVEEPVTTGARRFLELGSVRTVTINWLIWLLFWGGISPHRLARLYRR